MVGQKSGVQSHEVLRSGVVSGMHWSVKKSNKMYCSLGASRSVSGVADVLNLGKSSFQYTTNAAVEIRSGHQHGAVSQD